MKKMDCMYLAYHNLKTFKKSSRQYFISIFTVTLFLMLFISVSLIVDSLYEDMVYNSISSNNICVYFDLNSDGQEVEGKTVSLVEKLSEFEQVSMGAKCALIDLSRDGSELYTVDIENVVCEIGNAKYHGENDYSFDFIEEKKISNKENKELFSVNFSVSTIDIKTNLATENIQKEYNYKYNSEMFLSGREIKGENEIIISDYMLNRFGIKESYDSLMGQEISFKVNNHPVIDKYTVVGVLNSNYYRVCSNGEKSQIIIAGTPRIYEDRHITTLVQEIGFGDFYNSQTILDSIDAEYGECYFASLNIYTFEMIDKFKLVCQKIISVFVVIIIIAMFIKLVSNVYINKKNRAYYYGVLKAMGMENKEILSVSFCELFVIMCFSMISSVGLTFVILKILQYILVETVGYFVVVSLMKLWIATVATGGMVAVILFLISGWINSNLLKRSIIEVIRT